MRGLELVEEVEHDLGERERVTHLDAVLGEVVHPLQVPAPALAELHDRADEVCGAEDRRPHHRLADLGDLALGVLAGVGHLVLGAVLHRDLVHHVGRGRDQVEVELALEPLPDDLHVQQAEEATAEAEAECSGRLGLVGQRGVVELQLVERVAQRRVVVTVDRVQPGEHHRVRVLVAAERLGRAVHLGGHGVAHPGLAAGNADGAKGPC